MVKRFTFGNLRTENGFAVQDLLVAMFILVFFLGLITAIYVNFSNTSYEIKLAADATEIMTKCLDYYDNLYYDEINTTSGYIDKDSELFPENLKEGIDNKFNIKVNIEANEDDKKTITVKVEYTLKDDISRIENSIVKYKENIKPQNSPDLTSYNLTPIKYVYDDSQTFEGHWEKTDSSDRDWYNYENGRYAVAVSGDGIIWSEDGKNIVGFNDEGESKIYIWIPRFYVDNSETNNDDKIKFLYKNTDKKIVYNLQNYILEDANGKETELFENKNGYWIEIEVRKNKISIVTDEDKIPNINNIKEALEDTKYDIDNIKIPKNNAN